MKEIEVKAKVTDKQSVQQKLEDLGCQFTSLISQKDRIFIPTGMALPVESGVNVLRIREQDGKFIFTLKQAITNQLDCLEKESEVSNPQAMIDSFELLGFYEASTVHKQRMKCKYNGLEICLDTVEKLGDYIEVEKLAEEADSQVVQDELFRFLKTLGVEEQDRVHDGYDVLIAKLNKSE